MKSIMNEAGKENVSPGAQMDKENERKNRQPHDLPFQNFIFKDFNRQIDEQSGKACSRWDQITCDGLKRNGLPVLSESGANEPDNHSDAKEGRKLVVPKHGIKKRLSGGGGTLRFHPLSYRAKPVVRQLSKLRKPWKGTNSDRESLPNVNEKEAERDKICIDLDSVEDMSDDVIVISDDDEEPEPVAEADKVNKADGSAAVTSPSDMSVAAVDEKQLPEDAKLSSDGDGNSSVLSQIEETSLSFENMSLVITSDEESEIPVPGSDVSSPRKVKIKSKVLAIERRTSTPQSLRVAVLSKGIKNSVQKDLKSTVTSLPSLAQNKSDTKESRVESSTEKLVMTSWSDSEIRVVHLHESKKSSDNTASTPSISKLCDKNVSTAASNVSKSNQVGKPDPGNVQGFKKPAEKSKHPRLILSDVNVPYQHLKDCQDLWELATCKTSAYCIHKGKPKHLLDTVKPNTYNRFQNFVFSRSTEADVLELYGRPPICLPEDLEDTPICKEDIKDFNDKRGRADDYDKFLSNKKSHI